MKGKQKRQRKSTASCNQLHIDYLTVLARKVRHLVFPLSLLKSMVSASAKGAFRDDISLRYGWTIQNVSSTCACGTPFSVDHAMSSYKGGLPTLHQ